MMNVANMFFFSMLPVTHVLDKSYLSLALKVDFL